MLRGSLAFIAGCMFGGVVGVFVFLRIVGGSAEPSRTISAPTIDFSTPTIDVLSTSNSQIAEIAGQLPLVLTEQANLSTEIANVNQQVVLLRPPLSTATRARTPRPTYTPSPTRTPSPTPIPMPTAAPNQALFRIVSEESLVRFTLDEDLDELVPGLETTVIGTTDQVAGDILIDFSHPPSSRLGIIRINMRTLQTDIPDRDRAIRFGILETTLPEFEFSDFTPTVITGLPDHIEIGDTVEFQITGDFPLRGLARPVTFDIAVTLTSETQLNGYASATVKRSDYGINDVGPIAEDEVFLEIEFVARAVERVGS